MKIRNIILFVIPALLSIGCNRNNIFTDEIKNDNQVGFTGITTRAGQPAADNYGMPHSNYNLLYVPDTVGVFANKNLSPLFKNTLYRVTNYESNNYVEYDLINDPLKQSPLTDSNGKVIVTNTPGPDKEALVWYKTSHPAAYWDPDTNAEYDIYAYAPKVETGTANKYYNISDNGEVNFLIDPKFGITVDFIYAKAEGTTRAADAESLHLPFKHKLSKLVFKLKNSTENAITFYGLKYSINYPKASFNMITDEWQYSSTLTKIEINRYMQQEVFEGNEIVIPEITTLLFPTNASNITGGIAPANVFVSLHICLNNKWYNVSNLINTAISNSSLKFSEGILNELTFECILDYGTDNSKWNVFVATFDSFEYGGTIGGTLK